MAQENTQMNPLIEAVRKYFSANLISEGMKARKAQYAGNMEEVELTPEEVVDEWEKYCKQSALELTNFVRSVKQRQLNVEVENFIKEISPEELFK